MGKVGFLRRCREGDEDNKVWTPRLGASELPGGSRWVIPEVDGDTGASGLKDANELFSSSKVRIVAIDLLLSQVSRSHRTELEFDLPGGDHYDHL